MTNHQFETSTQAYTSGSPSGRSLQRPVPSPDGRFLAVIVPELELHIISLMDGSSGNRIVKVPQFPQSTKGFLQNVDIIRWSPETIWSQDDECTVNSSATEDLGQSWLLLAGDRRLIVLRVNLSQNALMRQVDVELNNIVCDIEFPDYYGKITTAEFISTHKHVFLLFDMNLHGSFLSLTNAERYDIKGVKFSSEQGFAKDRTGRYLALLRRENSQDQISVFDLHQDNLKPTIFATGLNDTQGIRWSPDGKPVLLIWESAAFGSQIKFFTALGHPLQLLDLKWGASTISFPLTDTLGTGITSLAWSKQGGSSTHTVLAVGDGCKQICFRCQKTQSLSVNPETIVIHPESVDSSDCTIWQEQADHQFLRESGTIEIPSDGNPEVEIVSISADGAMFATKVSSAPRIVWIWEAERPKPSFVIFFQDDIKQLLWHPTLAGVFVIIPKSRSPIIHTWYDKAQPPITSSSPIVNTNSVGSWRGSWIHQQDERRNDKHLFILSSLKQFQVGYLGVAESQLYFDSILDRSLTSNDETTMMLDTPSKPSRSENKVMNGHNKSMANSNTYWFSQR